MFDLECFQVAVAEYYGISKIDGTPPYSPAAHENTSDSDMVDLRSRSDPLCHMVVLPVFDQRTSAPQLTNENARADDVSVNTSGSQHLRIPGGFQPNHMANHAQVWCPHIQYTSWGCRYSHF